MNMSQRVLDHFKVVGRGYQTRISGALDMLVALAEARSVSAWDLLGSVDQQVSAPATFDWEPRLQEFLVEVREMVDDKIRRLERKLPE
jgi:hypothetical protein